MIADFQVEVASSDCAHKQWHVRMLGKVFRGVVGQSVTGQEAGDRMQEEGGRKIRRMLILPDQAMYCKRMQMRPEWTSPGLLISYSRFFSTGTD